MNKKRMAFLRCFLCLGFFNRALEMVLIYGLMGCQYGFKIWLNRVCFNGFNLVLSGFNGDIMEQSQQ